MSKKLFCRLQEILFSVKVGDKSSSLEVLLQKKNWFRYDIWLLNTKQNRVETRENKNCKTQFNFENKYPRLCQVQSLNMIGQIIRSRAWRVNTKKIQWGRRRIKHEKRFNGGKKKIVVRNQEMIYPPLISNNTFKKVLKFHCKLPRSIKSIIPYQWR